MTPDSLLVTRGVSRGVGGTQNVTLPNPKLFGPVLLKVSHG